MLTKSPSHHLASIRSAADADSRRLSMLADAKTRAQEHTRYIRAEEAAATLAHRAAIAEETASQAFETIEQLREDSEEMKVQMADQATELQALKRELEEARLETADVRRDLGHIAVSATARAKFNIRALRSALRLWQWGAAYERVLGRRKYNSCRRAFLRFANPIIHSALHQTMRRVRAMLRTSVRRSGFVSWRLFAQSRGMHVTALHRSVRICRRHMLSRAAQAWRVHAQNWKRSRQLAQKSARAWRGDSIQVGWTRLARHSRLERILTSKKLALGKRMMSSKMYMALKTWMDRAKVLVSAARKLRGALHTMRPRTRNVRRAFNSVRALIIKLTSLDNAFRKLVHNQKHRAFCSWASIHQSVEYQLAVLKVGGRAFRRQGFLEWVAFVAAVHEYKRGIRSSALVMLGGGGLRKGWFTLLHHWERECTMRLAIRQLRNGKAGMAFDNWRQQASWMRTVGSVLDAVAPSLRKRRRALRSWQREWAVKSGFRGCIRGVICNSKRLAFRAWRVIGQSIQHQLTVLKVGGRAFRRQGFLEWVAFVAAVHEYKRGIRSSALIMVGDGGLRKGWFTLLHHWERECTIQLAVGQLANGKASMAFDNWRQQASWMRTVGSVLDAVAPPKRKRRRAFMCWRREHAVYSRHSRCNQGVIRNSKRRFLHVWRAIQRSMSYQLTTLKVGKRAFRRRGFFAWVVFIADVHEYKRRIRGAALQMKGDGLRKGWFTLKAFYRSCRLLRLAFNGMRKQKIRVAFNQWQDSITDLAEWTVLAKDVLSLVRTPERRLRYALSVWRGDRARRARMRLARAGVRFGILRHAMLKWFETAEQGAHERARNQSAAGRAALALQNRAMHMGFTTWRVQSGKLSEAKRRARGAIRALQGNGLRKGWFSWRAVVNERIVLRARLMEFMNPAVRFALNSWLQVHHERMEAKRKLREAAVQFSTGGLLRAAWDAIQQSAGGVQIMRGAVKSWTSSRQRAALNTWRAGTMSKHTASLALLTAARERILRGLRAGWFVWYATVLRNRALNIPAGRNFLWVRPAFDSWLLWWSAARSLIGLGLGPDRGCVRHAFRCWCKQWSSTLSSRRFKKFMRALTVVERVRVCERGDLVLHELRHTGLRGISGIWAQLLLSESPQPSVAWVRWKAYSTRRSLANQFMASHKIALLAEGLDAIHEAAFAQRLHEQDALKTERHRTALKLLRSELLTSEAKGRLLRAAADKMEDERNEAILALDKQRQAALATLQAERAAAIAAMTPKPRSLTTTTKSPTRYHRWSTAAARGHAKLAPDRLDSVFEQQYAAALQIKPLETFNRTQSATAATLRARANLQNDFNDVSQSATLTVTPSTPLLQQSQSVPSIQSKASPMPSSHRFPSLERPNSFHELTLD